MAKARYQKYPRAIIQARSDHSTTLFATIPKKLVMQWNLNAGEIIEFVYTTKGTDAFVKIRKINV